MADDTRPKRMEGPMRVEVTRAAIARVGASPLLAIDPSIVGRGVMLEPPKPVAKHTSEVIDSADVGGSKGGKRYATAAHVIIRGPLSQRASWEMCGGYIDGYDAAYDRYASAHSDVEVDAVIVEIDSCGGDVAGLEQCVQKMREVNARSGKPVFFFINEAAYSAAYWISALVNTNGISLPEAAGVGSIGVISGWVDETEALKQEGVAVHLIRYPAGKAESHSLQPIPDLADARLRARTKATAERFIAAMAKARKLDAEVILGFDGETFNGAAAVKAGLADKIETFESLVARAQTAGRQWRRSTEKAMSEQAELETLRTFKTNALAIFGAKDEADFMGKANAAKEVAADAPKEAAKLLAAETNLQTLTKRQDDSDAAQAIATAKAEGKIVPANEPKAQAHYEKYGLESLKSYIDGLVRVTPAAAVVPEPKHNGDKPPAQLPPNGAGGAPPAAPAQAKAYENMSPMERAAYAKNHGNDAYYALKNDWIGRGKPAAA